jgi:hypothetical protein
VSSDYACVCGLVPLKCSPSQILIVSGETADDLTTVTDAFKPLVKGEIANSNNHSLTCFEGRGTEFKKP